MPVYHNRVANNPLLRKGGVHIKSKTGQRSRDRHALNDLVAEYMDKTILASESRKTDRGKQTSSIDDQSGGHNNVSMEGEQIALLPFCVNHILYKTRQIRQNHAL